MYSFDSRVRYSDGDDKCDLSILVLMDYLQDCACFQIQDFGRGVETLSEEGLAWIVGIWEIEIERLPRYCEDIRISTWNYETKRLQAMRCVTISDKAGNQLVRADSQWFIYDADKGRVVRIPESELVHYTGEPRLDMPPLPRRLTTEGDFREAPAVTVSEQHLDTNHHMNNAQYVLIAQESLAALGLTLDLYRITVQYRKMAWLGDTIQPRVYECDRGYVVDLVSDEGETYACVKMEAR